MASLEGTKTDRQALTGNIAVKPGVDGESVTITDITESTEDGGTNTVKFSDGSILKIKNGSSGKNGKDGKDGANGADGADGNDGKSAYQYAQDGGYTGTEEEFALLMAQENLQTEKVSKLSEDIATKASAIKEKASGEVIVVTDSAEAKPLGLAIDGKSEQNQYSGNQLFDANTSDFVTNGSSKHTTNNNVISYVPASAYKPIRLRLNQNLIKAGETYVFEVDELTNGVTCQFSANNGTNLFDCTIWENRKKFTVTIPDSYNPIDFETFSNNIYLSVSIYVSDESLSGTTCTVKGLRLYNTKNPLEKWEPFVGGKPSPSPEYKQEIRNTGVYDEASGKYAVEVKLAKKNLINVEEWANKVRIANGTSVYENNGITITSSGDDCYTSYSIDEPSKAYTVPVKEGMELALSWEEDTNANGKVYIFPNGEIIDGIVYVNNSSTKELIYTVGKGITFITFRFGVQNANTTISYKNILLRYANTSVDYEPYKKTTTTVLLDEPLRKGDKAYWNGGSKIRVDRYRDIKVINKATRLDTTGKLFHVGYFNDVVEATKSNDVKGNLCNKYAEYSLEQLRKSENGVCQYLKDFYVRDNRYSTVEEFSAYLAENPFEIEVTLATPITEEIDIDLGELTMFYPTTVISNDCNANMEVTYIADTKNYIDKLKAKHESDITALKTAIVALGGTV